MHYVKYIFLAFLLFPLAAWAQLRGSDGHLPSPIFSDIGINAVNSIVSARSPISYCNDLEKKIDCGKSAADTFCKAVTIFTWNGKPIKSSGVAIKDGQPDFDVRDFFSVSNSEFWPRSLRTRQKCDYEKDPPCQYFSRIRCALELPPTIAPPVQEDVFYTEPKFNNRSDIRPYRDIGLCKTCTGHCSEGDVAEVASAFCAHFNYRLRRYQSTPAIYSQFVYSWFAGNCGEDSVDDNPKFPIFSQIVCTRIKPR